jgi:hypothetical protein
MSIITKALKKAQERRSGTQDKENVPLTYSASFEPVLDPVIKNDTSKTRTLSTRMPMPLILLGITAVIILGVSLFRPESPALKKNPVQVISVSKNANVSVRGKASLSDKRIPLLTGIMYDPSLPQAVIDSALVTEGETVNGYTIRRIYPESVLVSSGTSEFEIKLK